MHFKITLIINLLLFQTAGIAAEAHIASQVHAFQQSAPHIHLDVHTTKKLNASELALKQTTNCNLLQASPDSDAAYYTSLEVFTEQSTKIIGKFLNLSSATLHTLCVIDFIPQHDCNWLVKHQQAERCPGLRLHLLLQLFII